MGIMSWIKSRPKKAADYGKKVIGAEYIEKGGNEIRRSLNSLKQGEVRVEEFNEAVSRLKLSKDDIKNAYRGYRERFMQFLFFSMAGIFAAFYLLATGASILQVMVTLVFVMIMMAQMMAASLRLYQIRIKKLVGLNKWFESKDDWWPPSVDEVYGGSNGGNGGGSSRTTTKKKKDKKDVI